MKTINKIDIGYRISDIRTIKFIYSDVDGMNIDEILDDKDRINLTLGVHTEFDIERNTVYFDVMIDLLYDEVMLINHVARTGFEIRGLEKIMLNAEEIDFPQALLEQLYGISFSHARALLATETARTAFKGKFYLPVVSPKRFIEEQG